MPTIRGLKILIVVLAVLLPSSVLAQYDFDGITLLSHVPLSEMGGSVFTHGNDIWGWTDESTNKNYAIFGRTDGTSFFDISTPAEPVYLGLLPTHTGDSAWRDIKVYNNHAYIVADNAGPHGLQIFDLTQLRDLRTPQTFSETAHHDSFRSAHNIAINEESGFAYIVGSGEAAGGLHILDLADPINPVVAGGFAEDGYTHDAQIVTYMGPDTTYSGSEIAFAANEDTLTIANVSNKMSPSMLGSEGYELSAYVHQGWLSEDHTYFFSNDELDEFHFPSFVPTTRTHVFDVSDLNDPTYVGFYEGEEQSIDHNLYVKGDLIFQANYTSGLRVLQINDAAQADLEEVAYFDTTPADDTVSFNGLWSVFPYFENGTIIGSDIDGGLFVWSMQEIATCDFNGDGVCDCLDIDMLTAQGDLTTDPPATDPAFDLNSDGVINIDDVAEWLEIAGAENGLPGPYLMGDANLDGQVDVSDFNLWNNNKFTVDNNWCDGDINGDGVADVSDFNIWNGNKFQSSSPATVPEPSGMGWLVWITAIFLRRRTTDKGHG